MASQKELDTVYIRTAQHFSKLSAATRAKVGAVFVTPQGILVPGVNGTPPGFDNECEYRLPDGSLVTKQEVIHAEMNCILKAADQGVSLSESTVYANLSPCASCAAKMVRLNLKRFVYLEEYRDTRGINILEEAGCSTEKYIRINRYGRKLAYHANKKVSD